MGVLMPFGNNPEVLQTSNRDDAYPIACYRKGKGNRRRKVMFYHVMYGDAYSHRIWAETEEEAKEITKEYRFTYHESDISEPHEYRPSVLAKLEGGLNRHDVIHSICFLSFLAHRLGAEPDMVCGDKSALHSLIHFRQFGGTSPGSYMYDIAKGIIFLESTVLGLPPKGMELVVQKLDSKHHGPPPCLKDPFDIDYWGRK